MEPRRVGDLEVNQDIEFERRSWRVERVGWGLMTLLIAVALTGALGGPGPLASATAETAEGEVAVEYRRFTRSGRSSEVRVSAGREGLRNGRLRLWVDRAYLVDIGLEKVVPEPASVETTSDRVTFVFPVRGETTRVEVALVLEPRSYGPHEGRLGVDGGPDVSFRQFVYP